MPELAVLTWNIAHGRGLARRQSTLDRDAIQRNLDALAAVIRRERPDVVALQEVDGPSTWSGGFDHLERLGDAAEMPHRLHGRHFAFTVGPRSVVAGTALLSRLPWVRTRTSPFASTWRDNKGWAAGTVLCGATEVEVFSVHLDFLNPLVRRRQVRKLLGELVPGRASVVVGDLNTLSAGRGALAELTDGGVLRLVGPEDPTYPAAAPRWCLDRVACTPALGARSARVLEDPLSDHRAVLVDFMVPEVA